MNEQFGSFFKTNYLCLIFFQDLFLDLVDYLNKFINRE